MFRASLRHLLAVPPSVIRDVYRVDVGPGFDVVGEAGTGEDTIAVVGRALPDLLLLDLSMPRLSGLDVMRELQAGPHVPSTLLLAGVIDKPQLLAAVQRGVRGLVLKEAPTELLFEAIMCVLSGKRWLDRALVGDLMELVGTPSLSPPASRFSSRSASRRANARCLRMWWPATATRKSRESAP